MNNNNPNLTSNAQILRKNMTDEERKLWYMFLRDYPVGLKRQRVIGKYIVDFYCSQAMTVIELDGSQHGTEDGILADRERDEYLRKQGVLVLRYSNHDIQKQFRAVCEDIDQNLTVRMRILPNTRGATEGRKKI